MEETGRCDGTTVFGRRGSWGAERFNTEDALRTGTAGSQGESPCWAIHRERRREGTETYRRGAFCGGRGIQIEERSLAALGMTITN